MNRSLLALTSVVLVHVVFFLLLHTTSADPRKAYCSGRGIYKSGICECDSDYFGIRCECDAENLVLGANLEDGCRPDNTTTTLCNNRGDCTCGKCECHPRENPFEVVSGDYCECDNFSCDRFNGELCSGPDHGRCECGQCVCNSEWDTPGYSACECRASNYNCINPYGHGQICDGHGTCECGKCKCDKVMWGETVEGQYHGQFCQNYLRSDATVRCVENC